MAEIIMMPRLSDTMTEGVVVQWLKKVGDKISEGDILAEIETDKATMEFESFNEGTLLYIGLKDGESAPVDSLLAILGEEGENIDIIIRNFKEDNLKQKDLQKKKKKNKIKISKRKVQIFSETIDNPKIGTTSMLSAKSGLFGKFRVDDGWSVETINGWEFFRDVVVEKEEVIDEGGVLDLSFLGITSLDEIISSYSNKKINDIKYLNLSHNQITNLDKIHLFKNLIELNLDSNNISILPSELKTKHVGIIILTNNPLSSLSIKSPSNCIIQIAPNCKKCGSKRSSKEFSENALLCEKCFTAEQRQLHLKLLLEDKTIGELYKPASSIKCFIATAVMGSYDHPLVIELRHFRDEWILKKKWGERFVNWYYHYGEIVAKLIEKSFVLKKLCYLLIVKPLVYLSRIMNHK